MATPVRAQHTQNSNALSADQVREFLKAWNSYGEHSSDLETYVQRARELRLSGDNQLALQTIDEALKLDAGYGPAHATRSGILGNLARYEEGVSAANLGLTLSVAPRDKAIAAYNKCFNLVSLNRQREAMTACNLSVQFDPKYPWGHFGRGKLYYYMRMWGIAGREFDKAVELDPNLGAAWAYRAEVKYNLGQLEEGMASAEKALAMAPKDPRSYRARALGFEKTKQFDAMLKDATKAVELDPLRPWVHSLRGQALEFLGRREEALAEFSKETDKREADRQTALIALKAYGSRVDLGCDPLSTITTPLNYAATAGVLCAEPEEPAPVVAPEPKRARRAVPGSNGRARVQKK